MAHETENMSDWRVDIQSAKYALGGNYSVISEFGHRTAHLSARSAQHVVVFLGDVPEDPKEWRMAPTFVGSNEVMVPSSLKTPKEVMVEGVVFLNLALARSPLTKYDAATVVPYLKDKLEWRVLRVRRPAQTSVSRMVYDLISLSFLPITRRVKRSTSRPS